MTALDAFTQSEWENAAELSLRCEPRSETAKALIDTLIAGLPFPDAKAPRPSTVERRRKALGALLADLLKLHSKGLIGSHGTARQDFMLAAHGFAFSVFRDVKDALVSAGLLHFKPGRARLHTSEGFAENGAGPQVIGGGWVARFKLTDDAFASIADAGVPLDAWETHWTRSTPLTAKALASASMPSLISLRASNEWHGGGKLKGEPLTFSLEEAGVSEMIADLEAHNEFMRSLGVQGIDFLGLRRLFNEGERDERRWRSGGRFYSINTGGIGTRYENMSAIDRVREIKIGGLDVAEVDMSASQLRLLYALQDTPLPASLADDPYALPGLERNAVKLVAAQALGKGKGRSKRWGKDSVKDYAKRTGRPLAADFDFACYQDATLAAHPILETLGTPGVPVSLELQYVESEIIRRAMADLRSQKIGSLPVHDSLIVPIDRKGEAKSALADAFRAQVDKTLGHKSIHHTRVISKAA